MNKYKRLLGNTMIFAIGTFSSKVLVFFMMRYYTSVLTQADFGISETVTTTANFLIPCATIGITAGIIRFGLERANDKTEVFTIGLAALGFGCVGLILLSPLIHLIDELAPYTLLICAYVIISSAQQVCHQFVRARGHVRLYALDGVFRTVLTISFSFLFLSVFHMGILGYLLGIMCADMASVIALFLVDNLYRFVDFHRFNPQLLHAMLVYSIPLIPTTICNLILSMSDRFFILWLRKGALGAQGAAAEVGLYSVSNKIPTLLVLVSSIFIEAWQISTIKDTRKEERESFFTTVGNMYQALVFLLISGITMCAKLAVTIFAAPEFYEAWRFIPLLVIGSGFLCLSNFMNSIYTLEKKSIFSFLTIFCGAALNLLLNYLMIPSMGPNGAALATMISYVSMFLIRAVHTHRYVNVHWRYPRFLISSLLLAAQCVLMLHEGRYWIVTQILFCCAIALLNAGDLLGAVRKVLRR